MFLTFCIWVNFFQIFVISRNTEILSALKYWLGMYVPYILNKRIKKECYGY